MKKIKKILLPLFIIFMGIALGILLQVYGDKIKFLPNSVNPVKPKNISQKPSLSLPLVADNANSKLAGVVYQFRGPIKDFSQNGDNYNLSIDTPASNFPKFIVTEKTQVLIDLGADQPPATGALSDVKNGQFVVVTDSYDLDRKSWFVVNLLISEPK